METIKFSIIIDNYNYSGFLRRAIESALEQTYSKTEVVVVDDGSTDESPDIVRSYGDRVIAVLKENGGQPSAFNAGFSASSGDAACFLDADDWLLPGAVTKIVNAFHDPQTAKVHWPLWIVDRDGQMTGRTFPPEPTPDGDFSEIARREGPFYDSRFLPPTSGSAWRREFLDQVMPIPDGGFSPTGAEVYLHSLVPTFGLMRSVHEPLGCYRIHGSNHFWGNKLPDQKIVQYLHRFEASSVALAQRLRQQGIFADLEAWKERNFNYLWLRRLQEAKGDISKLTAAGDICLLVNDCEWGEGDAVPGRRVLYFHENHGAYWLPPDDAAAIEHLISHRKSGARFLAFWWTSFWWFETYSRFSAYLRSHFSCVLENDRLIVFDLEPAGKSAEIET